MPKPIAKSVKKRVITKADVAPVADINIPTEHPKPTSPVAEKAPQVQDATEPTSETKPAVQEEIPRKDRTVCLDFTNKDVCAGRFHMLRAYGDVEVVTFYPHAPKYPWHVVFTTPEAVSKAILGLEKSNTKWKAMTMQTFLKMSEIDLKLAERDETRKRNRAEKEEGKRAEEAAQKPGATIMSEKSGGKKKRKVSST